MSRGRKVLLAPNVLEDIYKKIYRIIKDRDNEPIHMGELSDTTGVKPSRISAALQYGRRRLGANGNIPFWIMGGPKGYSLPLTEDGDLDSTRLVAYAIQNVKDVNSRARTQSMLYDFVAKNYEDELREGFRTAKLSNDVQGMRLDINPWGVYKRIMEGYGYEFDEDDDCEFEA